MDEALKHAAEPRRPSERPGSWVIRRASCGCGGSWVWLRRLDTGAYAMQGCVCHHPWTLALRLGLSWKGFGRG